MDLDLIFFFCLNFSYGHTHLSLSPLSRFPYHIWTLFFLSLFYILMNIMKKRERTRIERKWMPLRWICPIVCVFVRIFGRRCVLWAVVSYLNWIRYVWYDKSCKKIKYNIKRYPKRLNTLCVIREVLCHMRNVWFDWDRWLNKLCFFVSLN